MEYTVDVLFSALTNYDAQLYYCYWIRDCCSLLCCACHRTVTSVHLFTGHPQRPHCIYLHVLHLIRCARSPGLPDAWNEIINFDINRRAESSAEPTQPCTHFCLALGIRILIIRDTRIVILRGRTEKKLQWANVAVSSINLRMWRSSVYLFTYHPQFHIRPITTSGS